MLENMINVFVILGLMGAGGYFAIQAMIHLGRIEWVAPKDEVEEAGKRGREDRAAGRPFSPPPSPTSSAVWSAYERGFTVVSHRSEAERLQHQHDALLLETFHAKSEAIRLLRELHMTAIPTDLEGEGLGRIVQLMGIELRTARSLALQPYSHLDDGPGPMSIRGSTPTPPPPESEENRLALH